MMKIEENGAGKKHRWIRDEVVIDFPLPRNIQYVVDDMVKLDEAEDYAFNNYSETFDYLVRNAYLDGKLTKKQRDALCWKYSSIF